MKKILVAVVAGALLTCCLAACSAQSGQGANAGTSSGSENSSTAVSNTASGSTASTWKTPTESELATPVVDKQAKTVTVWGQVNAEYFIAPTHHFLVNKDGKNGEKAVLRAWATPADFHAAMTEIGATPGDNLTVDDAKGKYVEGDKVNIAVEWDGSNGAVPMPECIKTLDGSPYKTDIRFGGNLEASNEEQTGCLCCTFSCPVGICSNAAYTYDSGDVNSNGDVLPADGTYVKVTFALA